MWTVYYFYDFIGGYDGSRRDNILEYNPETEEWLDIGKMKEARYVHAVSLVSHEDFAQWCN